MFRFILLAFVAAVTAEVFNESQCPEPFPVQNFDFASFGQGRWYEVAKYENQAERGGTCSYCEYVFEGKNFKIKNIHVANKRLAYIEGCARLAKDAGGRGILDYTYPYGPNGTLSKHRLYVLSTDYKEYAIVYYCNFMAERNLRQDFSWIFSRNKTLSFDKQLFVQNFIAQTDFLRSRSYAWTDFSDAACTYETRVL